MLRRSREFSWYNSHSWWNPQSTQTCTPTQLTHISTCPQKDAIRNTVRTSILYRQSLRLRRICSRVEDFTLISNQLKTHLLAHSYNEHLIDQQIQKAANTPRTETLQPHPPRQPIQRTPLVITFHPCLSSLPRITKQYLPTLHTSCNLRKPSPTPL